jgi:2-polyprenyl-3-methyl-5-hydroxy-6-metoxy-1,4-benzoquinol methylase
MTDARTAATSGNFSAPILAESDIASIARRLFVEGPLLARFLQHHRHRIAPIARCISLVPPGSDVLDVGCGGGLFLACLVASGRCLNVHGVDASGSAIDAAQAAGRRLALIAPQSRIMFEHRMVQQGLPEGNYAVVSMIDVMHHVPRDAQRRAFLDAASRVRAGGIFLYKDMCDAPIWRATLNRLHDLVMARQWINYLPIETADAWAVESGLVRELAEERAILWYGHEIRVYRRPAESGR